MGSHPTCMCEKESLDYIPQHLSSSKLGFVNATLDEFHLIVILL